MFEKLKYLGTLGSVGGSGFQRSMVVYWEGLLEEMIGIPAGLLFGIIFSKITLYGLEKYFLFEGGLSADISFGMLLKLVLTGVLMILLACYTPAVTAANTTGMELISGQYKMDESMQRRTDLLKRHRVFGLCGTLAVKNVWARRKNYTFNGMLLVFTFCLLLDGLTAMRAFNGEYDLKDERERPDLQLWVELYTEDTEKIQSFYEQVLAFDEIKALSLERMLDLQGGLLGKDQIKEGAGNCQIASYYGYVDIVRKAQDVRTGETHSGYWIQLEIVGLDERTFQAYVERAGYEVPEKVKYPVLIEDYVRVQKGEDRKRKSILKSKAGGVFTCSPSYAVAEGEFVTILGPSGSGKSTLLHILGGVDKPTDGRVYIDGEDLYRMKEKERTLFRRRKIGQIYQFYNMIPVLNVEENICLPILLDGKQVHKIDLEKLLEILGLENRVHHLPNELSGGQQQRVSIGRGVISRPKILLADEPTGNLDRKNSREIIKLFHKLNREYGQTVLLITHDENIAESSERTIVIEDGKILKDSRS